MMEQELSDGENRLLQLQPIVTPVAREIAERLGVPDNSIRRGIIAGVIARHLGDLLIPEKKEDE